MDVVKNLFEGTLQAGISNVATTMALNMAAGAPTSAPTAPFNLVVWDSAFSNPADDANVEIVRVTSGSLSTGVYTVSAMTRAQESTSAANHNTAGHTYKAMLPISQKIWADMSSGAGDYNDDIGTANTCVVNPANYPTTLARGMEASFKLANTVTGTSTLNVNGTGATPLVKPTGNGQVANLVNGDILAGALVNCMYDGTNWVVQSPVIPVVVSFAYQQPSGTAGGAGTGGAWTKYPLNTNVENDVGTTLSSNTWTLPAGTYEVVTMGAQFAGNNVGVCNLRLKDVTDTLVLARCNSSGLPAINGATTVVSLSAAAKFTITSTKTFQLEYWINTHVGSVDLGQNATTGDTEQYGGIVLLKVA